MQTELVKTEQMLWKVPFPNAVLFPHLMGKMFQDAISFSVIGWLCASVSLFAAIGSENRNTVCIQAGDSYCALSTL